MNLLLTTYAERCLQLRDARYAVEDCGYRLRMALLELQACITRHQPDAPEDKVPHLMAQRLRISGMIGHIDDFRDYLNTEEAWS